MYTHRPMYTVSMDNLTQFSGPCFAHYPDNRSTPNCVKLSRNTGQASVNSMWAFGVYTRLGMPMGVHNVYPPSDVYGRIQITYPSSGAHTFRRPSRQQKSTKLCKTLKDYRPGICEQYVDVWSIYVAQYAHGSTLSTPTIRCIRYLKFRRPS